MRQSARATLRSISASKAKSRKVRIPNVPPDTPAAPTIRSLGASVYAPSLLFAAGQGAVIPIVALAARDVGASVPVAGLIVAMRGLGTLAFDLPAGELVGRMGERRAMAVGTGALIVSLGGCMLSTSPLPFAIFMFLMGCGWSVWLLSRLAYVSDVMPVHLRGRALSTLGGTQRIGNFVGPFIGAAAITAVGIDGAYGVHLVFAIAGFLVLFAVADPHAERTTEQGERAQFRRVAREHASVFMTAGVAALCIGALRASRHAVVPLWADQAGIDAAAVGVIFGIGSGIDMTLFYPAGSLSDRYGRKLVATLCLSLMAIGFLLLPLTHSFVTIVLIGALLGFGNGFGAGIVMTLGADFAPPQGRAAFLGVWRLVGDLGTSGGPLLASVVAGALSLAASATVVGCVGILGAVMVVFGVREPLHRTRAVQQPDEVP